MKTFPRFDLISSKPQKTVKALANTFGLILACLYSAVPPGEAKHNTSTGETGNAALSFGGFVATHHTLGYPPPRATIIGFVGTQNTLGFRSKIIFLLQGNRPIFARRCFVSTQTRLDCVTTHNAHGNCSNAQKIWVSLQKMHHTPAGENIQPSTKMASQETTHKKTTKKDKPSVSRHIRGFAATHNTPAVMSNAYGVRSILRATYSDISLILSRGRTIEL